MLHTYFILTRRIYFITILYYDKLVFFFHILGELKDIYTQFMIHNLYVIHVPPFFTSISGYYNIKFLNFFN